MGIKPSLAFQTACIAIASRLVASGFRIVESFNPNLQKNNVIANPPVVIRREVVTVGMAWLFSLITNLAINPIAVKNKWNPQLVTFLTSFFGSFVAESVGRIVAYRNKKLLAPSSQEAKTPPKPSTVIKPVQPVSKPEVEPLTEPIWSMPGYSQGYPLYTPNWTSPGYSHYNGYSGYGNYGAYPYGYANYFYGL